MNLDKLSKKPVLTVSIIFTLLFTLVTLVHTFSIPYNFSFLVRDYIVPYNYSNIFFQVLSFIIGLCFLYFMYKLTYNFFGVKEGIVACVICASSIGMVALLAFTFLYSLYVFLMTLSIGILGIYYVKETERIKFQVPLFYIGLGGAFLIQPVLTILIFSFIFLLIYKTEKRDLYKFKPLKSYYSLFLLVPVSLFIYYVFSEYHVLIEKFNNIEWYQDKWYEGGNFIGFYTLLVFIFFLPFSFFVLPSLSFFNAVKDNIEFKFFKIWFFSVLASVELFPYKSLFFLGLLVAPLSIPIACSVANMAMDFKKDFKTNTVLIVLTSLLLSLVFILLGLGTKYNRDNFFLLSGMFVSSFMVLNTMFLGGYAIIKRNFYKSFCIFFVGYSLIAIIMSGLLFKYLL